ncbi:ABC transporter ATP-binding protein [Bacillus horti]
MILETVDLKKEFNGKLVVDGVNLYLNEGESVGLLGPNGAGKSTTISMISSLVKPTSGDVRLSGNSILKHPAELRRVLGVVPQEIALYEDLTAYENLKFFGRIYKLRSKALENRIQGALELVGLQDRQKEQIKHYSGGMKRRINIAAALLHEPKIVIMDEPTVGIDPQSRNHILETVRLLNREKGLTVVYTSHYMEEVENLCDRVYIMDDGKVIASGTKDELKNILAGEEMLTIEVEQENQSFVEHLGKLESVQQISAQDKKIKMIVSKKTGLLPQIFQLAEQEHVTILHTQLYTPSLEDVFLHLTGRKLRD